MVSSFTGFSPTTMVYNELSPKLSLMPGARKNGRYHGNSRFKIKKYLYFAFKAECLRP